MLLDLDAFYPSVEVLDNPELAGKQVWNLAHGRDERPVVRPSWPKSISKKATYESDLPSWADR